jgi:hypothetical protein
LSPPLKWKMNPSKTNQSILIMMVFRMPILFVEDAISQADTDLKALGIFESSPELENESIENQSDEDQYIDDISNIGSAEQHDLEDVSLLVAPQQDFEAAPASENADEIISETNIEPHKSQASEPGMFNRF